MIVNPIEIHERIKEDKKQKESFSWKSSKSLRFNNRKTTRCRKVQVLKFIIPGTFPPRFRTVEIKTN